MQRYIATEKDGTLTGVVDVTVYENIPLSKTRIYNQFVVLGYHGDNAIKEDTIKKIKSRRINPFTRVPSKHISPFLYFTVTGCTHLFCHISAIDAVFVYWPDTGWHEMDKKSGEREYKRLCKIIPSEEVPYWTVSKN